MSDQRGHPKNLDGYGLARKRLGGGHRDCAKSGFNGTLSVKLSYMDGFVVGVEKKRKRHDRNR